MVMDPHDRLLNVFLAEDSAPIRQRIAARLGGNPQARRRQLRRALDRVTRQLGLEEVSDA